MNDTGENILLCLVNNDPCQTIFMTTFGQPVYSVTTPNARPTQPQPTKEAAHHPSLSDKHRTSVKPGAVSARAQVVPPPPLRRRNSTPVDGHMHEADGATDADLPAVTEDCHVRRGSETFVRRIDGFDATTGHVETTVGTIKSHKRELQRALNGEMDGEHEEVVLELLGEKDFVLNIPQGRRRKALPEGPRTARAITDERGTGQSSEEALRLSDGEGSENENSDDGEEEHSGIDAWDFEGPDRREYKWFMLGNSPIMALKNQSMCLPIARYRRAKLGIVSRPRKGFLEIFPHGSVSLDLIVTTFVGFMKTCVIPSQKSATELELGKNKSQPCLEPRAPVTSHSAPTQPPGRPSVPKSKRGVEFEPSVASSIPSRFHSAAALARKHSKSPPATVITLPPFAAKPRVSGTSSGLTEHV